MKKTIFLNYGSTSLIIKKKNKYSLIIENSASFVFLKIKKENIKINNNINAISIENKNWEKIKQKIEIINEINNFFYEKIKFNGKGFKLKQQTSKITTFLFNSSHRKNLMSLKSKIIKISKNSVIMLQKKKENNAIENLKKTIKLNRFTKKGIRNAEKIIIVKKK